MKRPLLHLAPMAGVTDAAMRVMSFQKGADVCYSEMVSAEGLTRGSVRTQFLMDRLPQEGPLIVQLYGGGVESLASAARLATEYGGFTGIDLNAGCPVPKVLKCGGGAALMHDPKLIGRMVAAVVAETELPVTVKTRIGLHPGAVTIFDVIKAVEDAGGAGMAVHGRFASAGHGGPVNLDLLAQAVQATQLPVVVNGGIQCAADAMALMNATQAAGLMIGRGAIGNPWLFNEIKCALAPDGGGMPPTRRTFEEAVGALKTHLALAIEFHEKIRRIAPADAQSSQSPEELAACSFRLYLFKYFAGFPGAVALRRDMANCKTVEAILKAVRSKRSGESLVASSE